MTPEVKRAALRMAAKAALLTLGYAGCASNPGKADGKTTSTVPDCEAYLKSLPLASRGQLPPDDPLHDRHDVYGLFERQAREDPRTQQCCLESLTLRSTMSERRFECCSALPPETVDQKHLACYPWGPPCPPEMV